MWRDIERVFNSVPRESEKALELLDEWARLRIEYSRLADLARKEGRPLPEPWPDPSRQIDNPDGAAS